VLISGVFYFIEKEAIDIMRRVIFAIASFFVASLIPSNVMAKEDVARESLFEGTDINISADTAVYSKYMWRGFKLDNDPVIQPGVYVDAYGFNASIWGSFDIGNNDTLDSDELDYSAGYTLDLKEYTELPVSVCGGYTYYDFIGAKLRSQEFYIGASVDALLSPSITWYHDFENEEKGGGHGDYIIAELSHSVLIPNIPASLDLGGHVGYNDKLFIRGQGGDVEFNAGLTINLSKNCTLVPRVGYVIPFGDLKKSDDGNQDNEFYGGGALGFTF